MKITKSKLKEMIRVVVKEQLHEMTDNAEVDIVFPEKETKAERRNKRKLAAIVVQDFFKKNEDEIIEIDTAKNMAYMLHKLAGASLGYSDYRLTRNFSPGLVRAWSIMENNGLTERVKKDDRSSYITLTSKGRKLAKKLHKFFL